MKKVLTTKQRRTFSVRNKIRANAAASGRPRLSVFRSNNNIYAQVIDDATGVTLASASSQEKDFAAKTGANIDGAKTVGKLVAERAKKAGVNAVVFDRGAFIYHGRVKALADAAREGGLEF